MVISFWVEISPFTFCTYFFLQCHWMGWLIGGGTRLKGVMKSDSALGFLRIYFKKCSLENHRCGWPLLFLKPAQQKFQSFRWNISCYFNVTFQAANFQIVTTCVMMVQARKERKKNGTLGRDRDLGLEITSTIQNYF